MSVAKNSVNPVVDADRGPSSNSLSSNTPGSNAGPVGQRSTPRRPMPLVAFDPIAHQPKADQRCQDLSTLELAQVLAARLTVTDTDWHRLKGNRSARAREQAAAALVYLLRDCPEEALPRLAQAVGWLDRSISAPPCPSHGDRS